MCFIQNIKQIATIAGFQALTGFIGNLIFQVKPINFTKLTCHTKWVITISIVYILNLKKRSLKNFFPLTSAYFAYSNSFFFKSFIDDNLGLDLLCSDYFIFKIIEKTARRKLVLFILYFDICFLQSVTYEIHISFVCFFN